MNDARAGAGHGNPWCHGQVMGTTGTTGMSWGTPGLVPWWELKHGWKIPELNGGFLRKSHIDTTIDSVFSSTPCLMKPEGMHVELMGGDRGKQIKWTPLFLGGESIEIDFWILLILE